MSDLTASDILAMNSDRGGFLEGNGIIILLLFLLFMGGGFGNFGGGANVVNQETLTRADIQDTINNQNVTNSLNNMSIGMNNGFNGVTISMNNGFNSINSNLANLGYQLSSCCCDLKTTIGTQADITRQAIQGVTNLINANSMQDLRDKIAEKDRSIQTAQFDASQASQTAQIEAFILANKSST